MGELVLAVEVAIPAVVLLILGGQVLRVQFVLLIGLGLIVQLKISVM